MKSIAFTVRGRGSFPLDMLRYDQCFPVTPQDVHKIDAELPDMSIGNEREVTLISYREHSWIPTEGRWSSFGWIVTEFTVE